MKPETKKWLTFGAIAIFSVTLAVAYTQYKKLMNYTIKFKGLRLKKVSTEQINFDLLLDFVNNSTFKFDILEQVYNVYVNDKFVSKMVGTSAYTIYPKASSPLGINVNINVKDITRAVGKNWAALLINPSATKISIDMNLRVKFYGIKINLPYKYDTDLKQLITPTTA